ncbi:acyl-CoA dehydrogenase family protein [Natrinema longum]|uniref:Acyl-CoA dehydrogenase family protein n=1 Tax=Natrinema longum TaxID=370324 RepID=A0A8A2UD79_9EURY|nr:acyl-CoA dehydrogenase family protein [Natrinema longum]MBZ6495250.1 acyl-CoA dehydrogenase family protein [Natrinema longum]QSW86771.1 acyl-CoA dehydrogenase family protein [Natrinema longum]
MGANTTGGVSFDTEDETELILDSLDDFIEREVEPIVEELGDTYTNPRKGRHENGRWTDELLEAREEIRRRSAEGGFYAMNLPEDAGGEGVSPVTWYRAKKHLASHGGGLERYVLAGPEGPKPLLLQAEGEQRERYLEPTVRAEKSTAFAQTEPGYGSDSPNMETTAEKDGDEWVLNGRKQWITNAPYADFVQLFARTTPQEEVGRYGGITCFILEREEYELGSYNNAVGAEGTQAEIVLDDVRVPEDRVLGEVDEAFYAAMEFLSLGRLELGAEAVGYAEYLLEDATEYVTEREAFGRTIGNFQQVSAKLARGRAKTYAADAAGLKLAWKMAQDVRTVMDSSVLKWFATNVLWEVADAAVQVHGANGLAEEHPYMDLVHQARILRIVEGTDEIQLNTIAKTMGIVD